MTMKKNRLLGISIILIITILLSGCGKNTEGLIATVDGEDITVDEFNADLNFFKTMYEKRLGEGFMDQTAENGKTYEEQLKLDIIEKLIIEKLIEKDSKSMGIDLGQEDIDLEFNKYVEAMGDKEKFDEYLEETGITEEFFKDNLRKEMLIAEHNKSVKDKTEITDDEAKAYFDKFEENLTIVRASHILVQTEEEGNIILGRLKNGEDFAELAKEESMDGSAVNGGDLGYFPKGKMIAEFEEIAFSLEPGQVSDLVKTEVGYHIIKVDDRKDSFDDLKEDIKTLLKEDKYLETIEKLKSNSKLKVYDEELKSLMDEEVEEVEENK